VPQGGQVLSTPAVWINPADGSTWVFVTNGAGSSGLKLTLPGGVPTLVTQWHNNLAGFSPLVANNVLYFAGANVIRAANPLTGALLWSDTTHVGGNHWESPIVVNATLYITDESSHLTAYALPPPIGTPTNTPTITLTRTITRTPTPTPTPTPSVARSFFPVAQCRVIDTRNPDGPLGGPALVGGSARTFAILNQCGLPADAAAVSANLAVTNPSAQGHLTFYPTGASPPLASTINYRSGQTRANNVILTLGPVGTFDVACAGTGTVDFILDVTGFFR
jgi:hypothetical protein